MLPSPSTLERVPKDPLSATCSGAEDTGGDHGKRLTLRRGVEMDQGQCRGGNRHRRASSLAVQQMKPSPLSEVEAVDADVVRAEPIGKANVRDLDVPEPLFVRLGWRRRWILGVFERNLTSHDCSAVVFVR